MIQTEIYGCWKNSQIFIVLSLDPLTTYLPLGEMATEFTSLLCPSNVLMTLTHILETTSFLTNGIFSSYIYCDQIKEKVTFSTDSVFKMIIIS